MWRARRGGAGCGRVPGRVCGGGGDGGRHGRGGGGGEAGEAFELHGGHARVFRAWAQCGRLVSGGAVNRTTLGTVARIATDVHALPAAVRADRRALAAIAAGHLSSDLCQGAVPALLPFLIRDRGLSYAAATALLLALTVSSSVIQPVLGHASDRMQGAWLMPAGVLVGGVGIAVVGLTGSYAATLCAVIVGGIGVAAFHPEGARYVPLVAGSGASTSMGLYSVGGNAGFVVGPVVVTAGVAAFGLRGTLLVVIIPALSALLLWSVRPRLVAAAASARASAPAGTAAAADRWGAFTVLSAMVVA